MRDCYVLWKVIECYVQTTASCQSVCLSVCHITSTNKRTVEFSFSSLCYDSSNWKFSSKFKFWENLLSDSHLNIKPTNQPTAVSVEQNYWQYKHTTAELLTTVTAGSDRTHSLQFTVTNTVKYNSRNWQQTVCDHNVTLCTVHITVLAVK